MRIARIVGVPRARVRVSIEGAAVRGGFAGLGARGLVAASALPQAQDHDLLVLTVRGQTGSGRPPAVPQANLVGDVWTGADACVEGALTQGVTRVEPTRRVSVDGIKQ